MDVSVIVPTYNRKESLERCLSALFSQNIDSSRYEIIVVDDASSDGTNIFLANIRGHHNNLKVIQHRQNLGEAITRNDGIRSARCEIIVFIDDDIVVDYKYLETHIQYHQQAKNNHIAVISNISYAPEVIKCSNFGKYLQSRYLGNRSPKEWEKIDPHNLPSYNFGSGLSSVRLEDLNTIGLFNENFHFYGGPDVYMGRCLVEAGVRLVYAPEAVSFHYDKISLKSFKKKYIELAREANKTIAEKKPEIYDGSHARFLLPINWKRDSFKTKIIKSGIRLTINPFIVFLLERWAFLTDQSPSLYSQTLFKFLRIGWSLKGSRMKRGGTRLVDYSNGNHV